MEFKPGDRVYYTDHKAYATVLAHVDAAGWIAIRFDTNIGSHDCRGLCEDGYGWYTFPRMLTLVESVEDDECIDINDLL